MNLSRYAVVVAVAIVASAACTAHGAGPAERSPVTDRELEITLPARVRAGATVDLGISGAAPDAAEASVVVTTTAGTVRRSVALVAGRGRTALGPDLTRAAGVTTVWVLAGNDQANADLVVEAGVAVSPIIPLVGPKSIVADGADHAMVVALPGDRFGNPVENRDQVELRARRPDGRAGLAAVRSTGLVVWGRVFSGTLAGRSELALTLAGADGPVADLDEVAGPPVPFSLMADDRPRTADGRTLHALRTDQLVDRYGNVLPDGTSLRVVVDDPNGRRQAIATTIDGRAELQLEAPSAPGSVRIVATCAGARSRTLDLEFRPAVDTWSVALRATPGGWYLDIGPVRLVDGGWAPDGTTAVLADGDRRATTVLDRGVGSIRLENRPSPGAQIQILGVRRAVAR